MPGIGILSARANPPHLLAVLAPFKPPSPDPRYQVSVSVAKSRLLPRFTPPLHNKGMDKEVKCPLIIGFQPIPFSNIHFSNKGCLSLLSEQWAFYKIPFLSPDQFPLSISPISWANQGWGIRLLYAAWIGIAGTRSSH